jgi:hypothetical protein
VSEAVEHLVVATLAVGGYTIQRAWALLPNLKAAGLTDSGAIQTLDESEVVRRLARSGYDRGPAVTMSMAKRIVALHRAVREGVLMAAVTSMREGRLQDAEEILCRINGVGPMVFRQFILLEGATK